MAKNQDFVFLSYFYFSVPYAHCPCDKTTFIEKKVLSKAGAPESQKNLDGFLSKELNGILTLISDTTTAMTLFHTASCQDRPWRGWAKVVLLSFLALATLLLVAAP